MPSISRLRAGTCVLALFSIFTASVPGFAESADSGIQVAAADIKNETVIVTGNRTEQDVPNKIEDVSAQKAEEQINVVNTEDMLKYLPSIVVRKRHYGDTQDPLATRTSGVGASARSLLFVDGILISSPIGNNNTSASPHFGIAAPQDIENFEVLYGPFAAEYSGNAIGAVLNITTRMPDHLEIYADALGAVENFSQYASRETNGTWQLSGGIGDREDAFSWRLSANHLETIAQPLAYVTLTRPATTSAAGTPSPALSPISTAPQRPSWRSAPAASRPRCRTPTPSSWPMISPMAGRPAIPPASFTKVTMPPPRPI